MWGSTDSERGDGKRRDGGGWRWWAKGIVDGVVGWAFCGVAGEEGRFKGPGAILKGSG